MPVALFEKARSAVQLLGEVAGELEGGVLDVEGAKVLVDVLTRCERLAVAGRGVAALRVATAVNWKHAGHRNPAEWLASTTGVSVGDAARELETAARLEELTATAASFARVSSRVRRHRRSRPARPWIRTRRRACCRWREMVRPIGVCGTGAASG